MASNRATQPANQLLDGQYLDKRGFCAALGICQRTADRWAGLRIGPPRTKAGRKVLYKKSSIAAWLERNESGSQQEKRVA